MLLDLANVLHSPSWSPIIDLPSNLHGALFGCYLMCFVLSHTDKSVPARLSAD